MNSHCLKLHWSFSISFIQFVKWWGRFLGKENFFVLYSGACTKSGRFMSQLTWDQVQFSLRFVYYIPVGTAKRKESLIQTFYETSAAHFFDWLTFAESANQNYFRSLFFSMQIFHTWENCTLADLKNSFYLLTF